MSVEGQFDSAFARETQIQPVDVDRASHTVARLPVDAQTVLDVGCGTGVVTRAVARTRAVQGLELSSIGVDKIRALGLPCARGSIAEMPFTDAAFDLVLVNEVLEHLDDEVFPRALREIHRVARVYAMITVPNKDNFKVLRQECPRCRTVSVPWGHVRSFRLADMGTLLPGFELMSAEEFGPLIPDGTRRWSRLCTWPRWFFPPLRAGQRCPCCAYVELTAEGKRLPIHRRAAHYLASVTYGRLSLKCPRWLLGLYRKAPPASSATH